MHGHGTDWLGVAICHVEVPGIDAIEKGYCPNVKGQNAKVVKFYKGNMVDVKITVWWFQPIGRQPEPQSRSDRVRPCGHIA